MQTKGLIQCTVISDFILYSTVCHHMLLTGFLIYNTVLFPCSLSPHWKETIDSPL